MASITPVVDGFVLRKGKIVNIKGSLLFTGLGLVYSTLPKLVHAHAKHILANPTPNRRGIEMYPHQLIATKIVRESTFSLPF